MSITLRDQVRCIERELALRKRLYPRWVSMGRLERAESEREIALMSAVLETLRGLPGSFAQEPLL